MNAYLFCLMAAVSASPYSDLPLAEGERHFESLYESSHTFEAAIRGQTPGYDEVPSLGAPTDSPFYTQPPAVSPNGGSTSPDLWSPYSSPPQQMYDPFLGQPQMGDPFAPNGMSGMFGSPMQLPGMYTYGAHGPQPYRFGWTPRASVTYMPEEKTRSAADTGRMGIFGLDTEFRYTTPVIPDWITSVSQQFNLRTWDGPRGDIGLPGSVYRFGWELELATPSYGPWSVALAFNPSMNTDFNQGLTKDAWNWDGWGMLFYRPSPQWMFVFGAGFWDRVKDRVIPYTGVVWTPTDRWEWRILFPESRVSYFLGNHWGWSKWWYVTGEYHVEAYEIHVNRPANQSRREQIELEDWRILSGLRMDCGHVSAFVEGGWVFGRKVRFKYDTPGFDISSGFIGRMGIRF